MRSVLSVISGLGRSFDGKDDFCGGGGFISILGLLCCFVSMLVTSRFRSLYRFLSARGNWLHSMVALVCLTPLRPGFPQSLFYRSLSDPRESRPDVSCDFTVSCDARSVPLDLSPSGLRRMAKPHCSAGHYTAIHALSGRLNRSTPPPRRLLLADQAKNCVDCG